MKTTSPATSVLDEVTPWPGISTRLAPRGSTAIVFEGSRAWPTFTPTAARSTCLSPDDRRAAVLEAARAKDWVSGWVSKPLNDDTDAQDGIAMLRQSYDELQKRTLMTPTTTAPAEPRSATEVVAAQDNGFTTQVARELLVLPWSTTRWDPFLVLGDARFSKVGFGWHPHRGFQTVTLVLEGELEHRDNAGGSGVLGRGDAQYMVAGRYAMHYELAHGRRPARTLQLWLNLPHELKVIDTRYVDLPAAEAGLATGPARPARVYAGRVGNVTGGPAERAKQFRLIDAQLDPGGELLPDIPYSHAAVVYVVDGDVQTGGCTVATEQSAWCDPGAGVPGPITVRASKPSHIVVYRVRAHPRTGRRAGPFVMSTEEEIQQAFADFEAGWFGPTPA